MLNQGQQMGMLAAVAPTRDLGGEAEPLSAVSSVEVIHPVLWPTWSASVDVTQSFYWRWGKRLLDLAFVLAVALPVLAMLLPLLAVIAFDGHSPFYRQARLGRHGRVFHLWKLRTMVPDADRELEKMLAHDPKVRAEWDHHQKLSHDPRVTRVGRLLRRTSLDELPQLLNVARGDMSLVGPRPMMPSQRTLYPGTDYFAMRPGITGLWQVSVRHGSSFAERACFDRAYFHRISLRTDLAVLLSTVRVVWRGTGC